MHHRYHRLAAALLICFFATITGCRRHIHQPTDDNNLLLGNPSNATRDPANESNYLIDHQYYIESYNRANTGPNWVSWHLCGKDLGVTDRLNNFRPDETLPDGWYEADNRSFKKSGFDKGHNCPSGDRTSTTDANSSTFLMDNIIPQAPANNEHTWEHLESYCRNKVKRGNEVYIMMGVYGSGGTGKKGFATSIDKGRINVPAHIWKIVLIIPDGEDDLNRIDEYTSLIAIDTPNDNGLSNNWMTYSCTVKSIEDSTGYHFFSTLAPSVQHILENKRFTGGN